MKFSKFLVGHIYESCEGIVRMSYNFNKDTSRDDIEEMCMAKCPLSVLPLIWVHNTQFKDLGFLSLLFGSKKFCF